MKKVIYLISVFLIFLSLATQNTYAQPVYQPHWESLDSRPIAPWFEDAKFGIFVHWGPYSVPAWSPKGTYAEWYQYWMQEKTLSGNGTFSGLEVYNHHVETYGEDFSYYDFGKQFTARSYDADKWAKLFEDAGAKYMIITSKHHDGFTLWPSEEANKSWGFPWNAKDVGSKRDFKTAKNTKVSLLGSDLKLDFKQVGTNLVISVPYLTPMNCQQIMPTLLRLPM